MSRRPTNNPKNGGGTAVSGLIKAFIKEHIARRRAKKTNTQATTIDDEMTIKEVTEEVAKLIKEHYKRQRQY